MKFEYKRVIRRGVMPICEMNRYGDRGWQLCNGTRSSENLDYRTYLFKRPVEVADVTRNDVIRECVGALLQQRFAASRPSSRVAIAESSKLLIELMGEE